MCKETLKCDAVNGHIDEMLGSALHICHLIFLSPPFSCSYTQTHCLNENMCVCIELYSARRLRHQ